MHHPLWNDASLACLAVGDAHVSRGAWASRPSIAGDAAFALAQVVDMARQRAPLAVLFVGDVLDSDQPDSEDMGALADCVSKLVQLGCPVGYVQGQHEMPRRQGSRPWLSLLPGTDHLDGQVFTL